jgi:hypothetical protein
VFGLSVQDMTPEHAFFSFIGVVRHVRPRNPETRAAAGLVFSLKQVRTAAAGPRQRLNHVAEWAVVRSSARCILVAALAK